MSPLKSNEARSKLFRKLFAFWMKTDCILRIDGDLAENNLSFGKCSQFYFHKIINLQNICLNIISLNIFTLAFKRYAAG